MDTNPIELELKKRGTTIVLDGISWDDFESRKCIECNHELREHHKSTETGFGCEGSENCTCKSFVMPI